MARIDLGKSGSEALKLENGKLYAYTKFRPEAADAIREQRVLFVSPTIEFNVPDRRTGQKRPAELMSVALTNTPFLDGLEPLELPPDSNEGWVNIAFDGGIYKGHPAGPFKLSMTELESILDAREGMTTPLHFDINHDSLKRPEQIPNAVGWVTLSRDTMDCTEDTKALSEIKTLLGLAEELGPDTLLEKIQAAVSAADAAHAEHSGEAPADEAAMAADPAEDEKKKEEVPMSVTPMAEAPAVEPAAAEAAPAGDSAALVEIGDILMSALGTDAAGVLAFLKENADKLSEMASAVPADGGPAEAAVAPMSRGEMTVIMSRLNTATAKAKALEVELEGFRVAECKRAVGEAIAMGRATDGEREVLEELYLTKRSAYDKLTSARNVVPMGRQSAPKAETPSDEAPTQFEASAVQVLVNSGINRKTALEAVRKQKK